MAHIISIGEALVEVMRTRLDCPLDTPAEFMGPFPSGAPAIFASAAARLGAMVGFVGAIGKDAFGDCIEARLRADGIDCSALHRVPDLITGIAFVSYRSDGSRHFVFHLPQSAAPRVTLESLPEGYLRQARALHVMGSALSIGDQMRETIYAAARRVKLAGGSVSLDPNLRPELMPLDAIRGICAPIVDLADWVAPSGEELMTLTGSASPAEGAEQLLARGVQLVALKRGAQGSTLYTRNGAVSIPAFQVTEIDPTGAGDCFDAALAVGLDLGWGIEKVGLFANAAGALATTQLGPMEGAHSFDQVCAFMASQGRPLPQD